MGRRVLFVVLLGGCFNFDLNFDFGGDGGCRPAPSACQPLGADGTPCDRHLNACEPTPCACLGDDLGHGIVVCLGTDLGVPVDLPPPPRDLAQPDDGGGGLD